MSTYSDPYLLKANIALLNENIWPVNIILDSAAFDANYISEHTAKEITEKFNIPFISTKSIVCTGFNNCEDINSKLNLNIEIYDEFNRLLRFNITVLVAPIDIDIIIGRNTIKQYNLLLNHFPRYVSSEVHECPILDCSCNTCELDIPTQESSEQVLLKPVPVQTLSRPTLTLNTQALYLMQKKPSEKPTIPIIEEIDDSIEFNNKPINKDGIHIEGPESLQKSLNTLVSEFSDIFSTQVRSEPALLPPMDLEVDESKWKSKENRLPPRQQSAVKQEAIRHQVAEMLEQNVITPSNVSEYSQVVLTPKANGKWRMTIDYRRLNLCTQGNGWPLPLIQQLLRRIGAHNPKYFGVMDLTSGYHQCGLSKRSRRFTAFITYMGVYEWVRLPMGLKGAASYFQMVLATIVLAGLLYITLELYLDDIIVYGRNEEEFLQRLKQVFERFREFRMTLNPSKCRFGMSKVEYLGHVIDDTGISFSRDKLAKVIEFRELFIQKDLKQFVGLANYFSSHIKNYAIIAKPLHDLMNPYKPRALIK